MNDTFEDLAEANAERHNENPELNVALVAAAGVGVIAMLSYVARRIAAKDIASRKKAGMYANYN